MSIIEQYQKELEEDLKIDELNLNQAAYILPSLKHKWVSRLINAKIQINKLDKLKKDTKEIIVSQLLSKNLTHLSIDRMVESDPNFRKKILAVDEDIENYKLIILYLEKVENIFKHMTYDIKNIIDLHRMETT